MKLVAESLNEFERGMGVKRSLDIGMDAQIRNFVEKRGYLIDDGQYKDRYKKKQPLWVCSKFGMVEFVRHLLLNGADPTANDSAALRWAAGMGHLEIVKMLLDAGADPHAEGTLSTWQKRSFPGEAFAWAGREGYYEVITALKAAEQGATFFPKPETEKLVKDKLDVSANKPQPELEEEPVEEPEENKGSWI